MRTILEGVSFGVGALLIFSVSVPKAAAVFLLCVAVASFTADCVRIFQGRPE